MRNEFQPNWILPPSKVVNEFLKVQEIDHSELDRDFQNRLTENSLEIDTNTADRLVSILGGNRSFWLNIQFNYEENIERIKNNKLDNNFNDFSKLIKEMKGIGWLPESDYYYLDQLNFKQFFGFTDFETITEEKIYSYSLGSQYKGIGNYEASTINLATLVRKAELEVKLLDIAQNFNRNLFVQKLQEIKVLSKRKGINRFHQELVDICTDCGVNIVFLKSLKKCPIRGISKFIDDKGVIVITDKYNKDHIFWQTFFHEAAHLVLHQDRMLHFDCGDYGDYDRESKYEKEADNFMVSQLLYPLSLQEVEDKIDFKLMRRDKIASWKNIVEVANGLEISPSLLVGVLKFKGKVSHNFFSTSHKRVFD